MEDKELVEMFNPTLRRRETVLFFLIMMINGLIWVRYIRKGEVKGGGVKLQPIRLIPSN